MAALSLALLVSRDLRLRVRVGDVHIRPSELLYGAWGGIHSGRYQRLRPDTPRPLPLIT